MATQYMALYPYFHYMQVSDTSYHGEGERSFAYQVRNSKCGKNATPVNDPEHLTHGRTPFHGTKVCIHDYMFVIYWTMVYRLIAQRT